MQVKQMLQVMYLELCINMLDIINLISKINFELAISQNKIE